MTYHLFLTKDPNKIYNDNNLLGEVSFQNFWTGLGWGSLQSIKDRRPDLLDHFTVICSNGEYLNLEEFLDKIDNLNIITP